MELKIALKDPRFCNGCPSIAIHNLNNIVYCGFYGIKNDDTYVELISSVNGLIRPQKCIEDNGE